MGSNVQWCMVIIKLHLTQIDKLDSLENASCDPLKTMT